jgi:hypothetical protein
MNENEFSLRDVFCGGEKEALQGDSEGVINYTMLIDQKSRLAKSSVSSLCHHLTWNELVHTLQKS